MLIKIFIVTAMIILGWSAAQDSHATLNRPDPTEVIWKGTVSMEITVSLPKELLRHPDLEAELPEAVLLNLTCLSDGWWEASMSDDYREIWGILTLQGKFALNRNVTNVMGEFCAEKVEEMYGYPNRESPPTRHL